MTTNQTIDGVPREPKWSEALLKLEVVREALTSRDSAERLKNMDAGKVLREGISILKELRALLDADECCHEFVPFQANCTKCGIPYKPATQSHGEPVAPFGYWLAPKNQPALGRFHRVTPDDAIIDSDSVVSYFDITPLYAEQPAPVAATDTRTPFEIKHDLEPGEEAAFRKWRQERIDAAKKDPRTAMGV